VILDGALGDRELLGYLAVDWPPRDEDGGFLLAGASLSAGSSAGGDCCSGTGTSVGASRSSSSERAAC
jgi:hypothetical protein